MLQEDTVLTQPITRWVRQDRQNSSQGGEGPTANSPTWEQHPEKKAFLLDNFPLVVSSTLYQRTYAYPAHPKDTESHGPPRHSAISSAHKPHLVASKQRPEDSITLPVSSVV